MASSVSFSGNKFAEAGTSSETRKSNRTLSIPKKFEGFEMISTSSSEEKKRKRSISPESSVEPGKKRKVKQVFFGQFDVGSSVSYTRSVKVDPSCEEALAKAWEEHIKSRAPSSYDTKEEKKYIACIEAAVEDGSDLYPQNYEIKKSKNPFAGNGLFAKEDGKGYKKNDVIDIYGGRLTFVENVEDQEYAFEWPDTAFTAFALDGKTEGNALRFMNHASPKKANVSSVEFFYKGMPYVIFIADKRISPGEELCYDYGPEYWKKKGVEPK
ncbi:MAG TPA: hypothetical protein DCE71_05395 [Parachlamydiales bacterium]|nr:hypothetical protein [Parachlamydiales bacterium]